MSQDILRPITGTAPVDPNQIAPSAPPTPESPSFQRLFESLQKLAAEQRRATAGASEGVGAGSTEQLQQALKAADDGFVTAMDLRHKLEAAFRAQRP